VVTANVFHNSPETAEELGNRGGEAFALTVPDLLLANAAELGLYLQQAVGRYSDSTQTPDFGSFFLDDRGELILSLGTASAAESPKRVPARRTLPSSRFMRNWLPVSLTELDSTRLRSCPRFGEGAVPSEVDATVGACPEQDL
jgi:hypothetical protein